MLEAQLRIGLNGEASGIAFDPLLLRYSRSLAALGIIDKGDHALHTGFKAAVPARDMHGVIGRLLLVDPLDICASVLIQQVHQHVVAHLIHGLAVLGGGGDVLRFTLAVRDGFDVFLLALIVQLAEVVAVGNNSVFRYNRT